MRKDVAPLKLNQSVFALASNAFLSMSETPMSLRTGAHTWRMENLTCLCRYVMSDMGSEGCLLFGTKIPRSETSHYSPEYGTASPNAHAKLSLLKGISHLPISGQ